MTSVYVILPSLIDFLASVGVLVCSDTFRSYLFFLFFFFRDYRRRILQETEIYSQFFLVLQESYF